MYLCLYSYDLGITDSLKVGVGGYDSAQVALTILHIMKT